MRFVALIHNWGGGLLGLFLALLGLSGAVLVWKEHWLRLILREARVPAKEDAGALAASVERITHYDTAPPRTIVLPTDTVTLFVVSRHGTAGYYQFDRACFLGHWGCVLGANLETFFAYALAKAVFSCARIRSETSAAVDSSSMSFADLRIFRKGE